MGLEVIYVTRHGFRSGWLLDPSTGKYTATIRSPTGIATDPGLTAHGLEQARELGRHLLGVVPPIERTYSSPYYRCLQTIEPFARAAQATAPADSHHQTHVGVQPPGNSVSDGLQNTGSAVSTLDPGVDERPPKEQERPLRRPQDLKVRIESGLGEWFGSAPFEHPAPAPPKVLMGLFSNMLDESYTPEVVPPRRGETIEELHERVALVVSRIIERCDMEGARAVVICTHAAVVIALGRVLTGEMPEDVIGAEDFGAYTCGLSVYRRRGAKGGVESRAGTEEPPTSGNSDSVGTRNLERVLGNQPGQQGSGNQDGRPDGDARAGHDPTDSGPGRGGPAIEWRRGRGVGGGWLCEANSDCSFLSGGRERGWHFAGDEEFTGSSPAPATCGPENKRTSHL